MGVAAFAVEQRTAELVLELLDRAGQSRLADVALLGGAREIQRPRERDEVADLLHFHGSVPSAARRLITRSQRNSPATGRYRVAHRTYALSDCDRSAALVNNRRRNSGRFEADRKVAP